ncbi:hypothetical protein [Jatrophihabitans endophyticus]|uniref:hypothetical protein n=1 Tax=Jatrophihabitans endophyticus TaxID=1206085 RepID=UPI001A1030D8|nr:hypothetical protein [Jatrophihabitans endophyticus]MBE7190160.1 hypothetical protein [Jatrophihabitans endophyticus]
MTAPVTPGTFEHHFAAAAELAEKARNERVESKGLRYATVATAHAQLALAAATWLKS